MALELADAAVEIFGPVHEADELAHLRLALQRWREPLELPIPKPTLVSVIPLATCSFTVSSRNDAPSLIAAFVFVGLIVVLTSLL